MTTTLHCRRCGRTGHCAQRDSTDPLQPAGNNCRRALGLMEGAVLPPRPAGEIEDPPYCLKCRGFADNHQQKCPDAPTTAALHAQIAQLASRLEVVRGTVERIAKLDAHKRGCVANAQGKVLCSEHCPIGIAASTIERMQGPDGNG